MGSAASSLSPEQSAELTRLMKLEYEQHAGKSDEEIRTLLIPKYNAHLTKVLQTVTSMPLASGSQKAKNNIRDKGPTRRRSFGEDPKKIADMALSQSSPILIALQEANAATAAVAAVAEVGPTKDSWDSVTEQPYCAVCCMGFKTASALNRHVQYSDLHAKQLAKLEKDGNQGAAIVPDVIAPPTAKVPVLSNQEEGNHYRLLYSGSKLFWRTSTNIDMDIYIHVIAHCVEIIPFDSVKGKEFNRIYLDYTKAVASIEQVVLEAVQKKRSELKGSSKGKFTAPVVNEAVLVEEARHLALSSYVLNRLQLDATQPLPISFVPTSGDRTDCMPLLAQPPVALIPIQVNRRRKTSTEEITQTIQGLQTDYADLKAATQKAEKVSCIVFEGANMLTSLGKANKLALSKWAKMWRWAIRLVIRRKHVARMTIVIADWEKRRNDKLALEKSKNEKENTKTVGRPSIKLRRSFDGKVSK